MQQVKAELISTEYIFTSLFSRESKPSRSNSENPSQRHQDALDEVYISFVQELHQLIVTVSRPLAS